MLSSGGGLVHKAMLFRRSPTMAWNPIKPHCDPQMKSDGFEARSTLSWDPILNSSPYFPSAKNTKYSRMKSYLDCILGLA